MADASKFPDHLEYGRCQKNSQNRSPEAKPEPEKDDGPEKVQKELKQVGSRGRPQVCPFFDPLTDDQIKAKTHEKI